MVRPCLLTLPQGFRLGVSANHACALTPLLVQLTLQDLVNTMSAKLEELREQNAQLMRDLVATAQTWRDVERDNCHIKADLMLARALKNPGTDPFPCIPAAVVGQ